MLGSVDSRFHHGPNLPASKNCFYQKQWVKNKAFLIGTSRWLTLISGGLVFGGGSWEGCDFNLTPGSRCPKAAIPLQRGWTYVYVYVEALETCHIDGNVIWGTAQHDGSLGWYEEWPVSIYIHPFCVHVSVWRCRKDEIPRPLGAVSQPDGSNAKLWDSSKWDACPTCPPMGWMGINKSPCPMLLGLSQVLYLPLRITLSSTTSSCERSACQVLRFGHQICKC